MRYRIGVIDDFNSTFAFIDYRTFGDGRMQVWDACKISTAHRGHALSTDSIAVFLNFNKLGNFKIREEADRLINKLILDSPVDLSQYKEVFE